MWSAHRRRRYGRRGMDERTAFQSRMVAPETDAQVRIRDACIDVYELLIEKNRRYGNSALDPVRLFSRASPVEQLLVRLDDKLSRVRSGQLDEDEDVELDLLGYLVLLRVARGMARAAD